MSAGESPGIGAQVGDPFVPLYRRVLGQELERLPSAVRRLHDHGGRLSAVGSCQVQRGRGLLARRIAGLFRLPPDGRDVPLRVSFTSEDGVELWRRDFAGDVLVSRQGALPARPGLLYEDFGLGRFAIEPRVSPEGLELHLRGATLFGLALPRWLWPRIIGREGEDAQGRFTFFVTICLPLIGLLVHYDGHLVPEI